MLGKENTLVRIDTTLKNFGPKAQSRET
jgi:hypothetical protein